MFYLKNLILMLDELANTLTGGYPDETISLRVARKRNLGVWYGCVMCRVLDWFAKNHCDNAIANEHNSIIDRKL